MVRKHGGIHLAAVFVLSCCALFAPTAASAEAIRFSAFSGPTNLVAGMQGTYQLEVELLGVGTTTVTDFGGGLSLTSIVEYPIFTFDSAEGESVSTSPLSAPFSGPFSTSATFTFENPGSYLVSAFGSVTTHNQSRQVVQIPRFVFNANCNCNVQVGFDTRVDTTITSVTERVGGSLQVTVSGPQQVTPVPEPASFLLLVTGLAGVAAKARHRRNKALSVG